MSSHPPAISHPSAPVPDMEVKTVIPAKRGPEEDVQFLSVQPVKKCRGSGESPLVQQTQQTQQTSGPSDTHPKDHQTSESRALNHSPSTVGGGTHPPGLLNPSASLPSMENYVFPPPPIAPPGRAPHSSPMLSPKQLPPPQLSTPTQNAGHGLPGLLAPPVPNGSMPPREFHVPWGMSSLYPQPGPMNTALSLHRPLLFPPVKPQRVEPPLPAVQNHEQPQTGPAVSQQDRHQSSYADQLRMPEMAISGGGQRLTQPETSSQSQTQQEPPPQARTVSQAPPQLDQHAATLAQNTAPTLACGQPRPHAPPQATANDNNYNNSNSNSSNSNSNNNDNNMAAYTQLPTPKPPCDICEQMRQRALYTQANGLPVVHPSHMQHGWHGPGTVPQQMHMIHQPQIGGGFAMRQHMPHVFPTRFQHVSAGHVPVGYVLPQGPFQVPIQMQMQMQMQRPVSTANAPGTTPAPEHSPSARENEDNQTQQQTASGQLLQFASVVPPPIHSQHMQGQVSTLRTSMVAQRPAMVAQSQAQAPPTLTIPPSPAAHPTAPPPQELGQQEAPRVASPNLIVDIAETCEDIFPWEEVAKRHGVSRNKVVETFSAIIQLPLLRCTTDKKRHGKLATSRLREYTKAKKDVEAASPASAPAVGPFSNNQDRSVLPGVLEVAGTMAPLGLPSTLTHGLTGPWQR